MIDRGLEASRTHAKLDSCVGGTKEVRRYAPHPIPPARSELHDSIDHVIIRLARLASHLKGNYIGLSNINNVNGNTSVLKNILCLGKVLTNHLLKGMS